MAEEDVSLDEPRQPDLGLVRDVLGGRDGEDLCDGSARERVGSVGDSRSISSRVSCFVSRTKQNIMPQAIRLRPA